MVINACGSVREKNCWESMVMIGGCHYLIESHIDH